MSAVDITYKDADGNDVEAVEGVDYKIEAKDGLIFVIAGGAIDGKDVLVDYDYATTKIEKVEALVRSQTLVQLEFYGKPQHGKRTIYTFYKVQLVASGDIKLKDTNKFIELSFTGEVLATGNEDNPYFNVQVVEA